MKYDNLPFPIGTTYFDAATANATDGANYEGREYLVEDLNYNDTTPVKSQRSQVSRYVRIMRNVSGVNILPGQLVTPQSAGTSGMFYLGRTDGLANATAVSPAFPADEFLPAAGVQNNDLFYVVIKGPAMCKTDLAGGANNVINVGGIVVALTAATSGATTAGRVAPQDLTGATSVLGTQILGTLGRALSAKTTSNTNANILININEW